MKKLGLVLVGILLTIVLAVAWADRDRSANEGQCNALAKPSLRITPEHDFFPE